MAGTRRSETLRHKPSNREEHILPPNNAVRPGRLVRCFPGGRLERGKDWSMPAGALTCAGSATVSRPTYAGSAPVGELTEGCVVEGDWRECSS